MTVPDAELLAIPPGDLLAELVTAPGCGLCHGEPVVKIDRRPDGMLGWSVVHCHTLDCPTARDAA